MSKVESHTTDGLKVSVRSQFEEKHSSSQKGEYIFSYTITIENQSNSTVQLISRHWIIFDSNSNKREVKGDGVIGKQPILQPGASHTYSSWCPLHTPIGQMKGSFQMINKLTNQSFDIIVPEFNLIADFKNN